MYNVTQKFSINSFVIYALAPNELVVMHNKGIVKIYDPRMIELITEWDTQDNKIVTYLTLENTFQDQCHQAIVFLIENAILFEEKHLNYDIKNLSILSNNKDFLELSEKTYFQDLNIEKKELIYHSSFDNNIENFTDNSLIVVFLNPYNKKLAFAIREALRKTSGSLLLMSYTYNSNFYIDSLYFPELYVPCHLCHMGHIESQLRVNTDNQITYQQIIDSIYYENPKFSIHMHLNKNQLLQITSMLSKLIFKHIVDYDDLTINNEEFQECTMLDLQSGKVFTDYSLHWELCDCYE